MKDRSERIVVGIGGRSGSGKTTVVQKLLEYFGSEVISLHTMDNYYLPRHQQMPDDHDFLNFDLPTSFRRDLFFNDLKTLKKGVDIRIEEYIYNNEREPQLIHVLSRPIILVEGLFIFHYNEVRSMIDLKVLIDVPFEIAFRRRLQRDLVERNYQEKEIVHRYHRHAEPAFQQFIKPYTRDADVVVSNTGGPDDVISEITREISEFL